MVASNWLSGIFLAHCILVPIFITIYYNLNSQKINDKDFNDKVGSFVEGANRKKRWQALILPLSFFVKCIVLCVSLVFIENVVWGQLFCNFAISTANLILIAYLKPYDTKL